MGLPAKRRTSRSRDDRRSHFALKTTTVTKCVSCGANVLPHRACAACGTYKGKKIVGTEKRATRLARRTKKIS
ncbi:MAG: 50S ribosomal protein L32 [Candidatus Magasanikbacteria bacterium]